MNYILSLFFALILSITSTSEIPYSSIKNAFERGNANVISNICTSKVMVTIQNEKGVYSQSQANQMLGRFFKNNPPLRFEYTIKGKENNGSSFSIAKYSSKNGKVFTVQIKVKNISSKYYIESIQIKT